MFVKKELSEEELKERRLSLDASLKRAEEAKKKLMKERTTKLRNHSLRVSENRIDSTTSSIRLNQIEDLVSECSEFLSAINEFEDFEMFQSFMQKPETIFKASKLVHFIENQCSKGSCDSVKSRPKVLMSLILLARYPNEVMPNADSDEQMILEKAKAFYEILSSFFVYNQKSSNKDHEDLAWSWIGTINVFDEWLIKDKQILFEKMKTDFLTWTKTIGAVSINDKSRFEWEPHAIKYQIQILRKVFETFGEEHLNILLAEVKNLNENFSEMELIIDINKECYEINCKWEKKFSNSDDLTESTRTQIDTHIYEKLKTTNIRILHELMIKETDFNFESILKFSGKSMNEISKSNKENLSKLVSILETESDSSSISNILQELFQFVCSSLYELAGDNDDYCQEIKSVDCSVDPDNWLHDSCEIIRWALSMCRKCCAPVRDSNCQELEVNLNEIYKIESNYKISESFTNIITLLLDLLNFMRNDFCNFRLKFLASQIEGKGIIEKYEFEELEKTFPKYENTIKWLSKRLSNDRKLIEILIDSFISFFDTEGEMDLENELPETFYLDIERIKRYKIEFENMLRKEAGIIYLRNHLRSSAKDGVRKDVVIAKVIEYIKEENDTEKLIEIFIKSINELPDENNSLFQGNINRLFTKGSDDKVFSLLKNRELSAIRTILMSEQKTSNESVRGKICSLFRYNKSCFSSIYEEIILKKLNSKRI